MESAESQFPWSQVFVNKSEIDNLKENNRKLDTTLGKFMDRVEEKLDELNKNMNNQFLAQNIKIAEIAKKQSDLESRMRGGWLVICSIGAILVGVLSFFNTIHTWLFK